LESQTKEEKEYNLVVNGEGEGNGRIRLRLQFLYSRYNYFSNNFTKTEAQIIRLQEDITELNRLFELFSKPFGILLYGEINLILEKKILERSEDLASYAASNRRSVYAAPRLNKQKGLTMRVENVLRATLSN